MIVAVVASFESARIENPTDDFRVTPAASYVHDEYVGENLQPSRW